MFVLRHSKKNVRKANTQDQFVALLTQKESGKRGKETANRNELKSYNKHNQTAKTSHTSQV